MTAGRGLVHSEMPEQHEGRMRGFQLWLNLPARDKMTAPKYQEFGPARIPSAAPAAGVNVRVIAGRVADVVGPISQPATDPTYLDVAIEPGATFVQELPTDHAAFLYVFEGSIEVGAAADAHALRTHELAVLSEGAEVRLTGAHGGKRRPYGARHPRGRTPAARGGRPVRSVRDEYARGAAAGVRGLSERPILRSLPARAPGARALTARVAAGVSRSRGATKMSRAAALVRNAA